MYSATLVYNLANMRKYVFFFVAMLALVLSFHYAYAQSGQVVPDQSATWKAKVLQVESESNQPVEGTAVSSLVQSLDVQILEGPQMGKELTVENDTPIRLSAGDIFYLSYTKDTLEGTEFYTVSEPYRLNWMFVFIGLFVICVIYFGGIQGIRGLISLAGSLLLIIYVLLPGILHGYSPVLMSVLVASLIIIVGSYITHGFSKMTTAAVVGMIATVFVTGCLAYTAVHFTKLTGFDSEEAAYLNFDTNGSINFQGLLLGGILIGLLGVLYNAAIGQALAVEELHKIAPHVHRSKIYSRAIRMGREHIGALVNTLAIAYVGASLPLLLLFYSSSDSPLSITVNREIFATEIIRTVIGSLGLILAVPLTTWIAVLFLVKIKKDVPSGTMEEEMHALEHVEGHGHTHAH